MIIDSLTHVTPDGRWFDTEHDASEDRLLADMDEAGIDQSVVVALAGHIDNAFVSEVCRRHPDRLIPGASFNPAGHTSVDRVIREFRSQIPSEGFNVLKLHPRLNGYDPLDPRCLAVLEEIASSKSPLPVWMDTLFHTRDVILRKSVPDTVHELAYRFPSIPFVLLHAGGSYVLHVADAVREFEHVFLDISFTFQKHRHSSVWQDLRYLVDRFDRRLVFGSDFPEFSATDSLQLFYELSKGLSAESIENVLGKNLAKLMRDH